MQSIMSSALGGCGIDVFAGSSGVTLAGGCCFDASMFRGWGQSIVLRLEQALLVRDRPVGRRRTSEILMFIRDDVSI